VNVSSTSYRATIHPNAVCCFSSILFLFPWDGSVVVVRRHTTSANDLVISLLTKDFCLSTKAVLSLLFVVFPSPICFWSFRTFPREGIYCHVFGSPSPLDLGGCFVAPIPPLVLLTPLSQDSDFSSTFRSLLFSARPHFLKRTSFGTLFLLTIHCPPLNHFWVAVVVGGAGSAGADFPVGAAILAELSPHPPTLFLFNAP